jgi:predicted RNA binding protein YcfA (HicA-like mRNA interferase family)
LGGVDSRERAAGAANSLVAVFPSMKARQLLAVLTRPPLRYRVVRQTGSHRRLRSSAGYPPLTFAWHDGATIAPGVVRDVLVEDVGLSVQEALRCVRNKR